MAKFKDEQGNITEIGSPELNPQLVQGRTRVPDTTPLGSIDSSTLTPPPSVDFQTVTPSPVPGVQGFDSELSLGKEAGEVDDLSKRIQSLNEEFIGKSAFTAQQQELQDIPGQEQAERDLAGRLKELQREALDIPNRLQIEAKGRGVTSGGLAPQERGMLRENAIEANRIASLLDATRGNLVSARAKVDRAVGLKYDPIIEKRDVAINNLKLIKESPSFTKAQKDRADKRLAIEEKAKQEAQADKEREKLRDKQTLKYAGIADALTLDEMSKAESAIEVERIAAEKGFGSQAKADQLQFVSGTENQQSGFFNKTTGEFTPIGGGGPAPVEFTGTDGETITLTKRQADDALEIGGKVTADPVYKDMTDIQRGLIGVFVGLDEGNGFGDVAAINAFQRMIDPGATVRSEDVVLLQSASALLAKIDPRFITGKVTKGDKLPEQVRQQMRDVSEELYDSSIVSYSNLSGNRFNAIAASKGLVPEMIGTNFPDSKTIIDRKQLTLEQKTQALDKMVGTETETTKDVTVADDPVGFVEGFLSMFGLTKKQ